MALQWRADMSIGVEKIDAQHRQLVEQVSSLLDACTQGKGKQEVGRMMAFLGEYVLTHFADEEELQLKSGYPGYREHKALHEQFVREYGLLNQQLLAEGASVRFTLQVNRTVVDWLVQHISKADKALGEHLAKQ
jgi:hemerythrin